MSVPSQLPANHVSPPAFASASCSATTASEPFVSSEPLESRATFGSSTPSVILEYARPMCANCTSISGRTSAFAPMSRNTECRPSSPGTGHAIAGRFIPRILPTPNVAAAKMAPVEPAEKNPSASPACTAASPRTMLESFFARMASVGCSPISIVCVVTSALARSCLAQNGTTTSSLPATSTLSSPSASSAAAIPSSTTLGSRSPPMASMQIVVMCPPRGPAAAHSLHTKGDRPPEGTGLLGLVFQRDYSVTTTSRSL